MLKRCMLIMLLLAATAIPAGAAEDPLTLTVPVSPELSRYGFLLEEPSYAALALQNAGLNVSLSKPLVVLDRRTLEVGPGRIGFVGKKGSTYQYMATLTLPLGKQLGFPVEVEWADTKQGRLLIRLQPPLAGLIPRELLDKVESKLQTLGNATAQKALFSYLAKVDSQGAGEARLAEMRERIAFDAYAQAGLGSAKDAGGGEPVSDQVVLLASVLIWAICWPSLLYVVRRHRSQRLSDHGNDCNDQAT